MTFILRTTYYYSHLCIYGVIPETLTFDKMEINVNKAERYYQEIFNFIFHLQVLKQKTL